MNITAIINYFNLSAQQFEKLSAQQRAILWYIYAYGSISPMEAFSRIGCTKLSTRIGELIRSGYKIRKVRVTRKNRYGHTVTFMRYSLED